MMDIVKLLREAGDVYHDIARDMLQNEWKEHLAPHYTQRGDELKLAAAELEGDAEPDYWVASDGIQIEFGMRKPGLEDDGANWCARTEVNDHINERMTDQPGLILHLEPLYRHPPTERAVPEWIPVSERLPDENEMVLVYTPGEEGGTDFDFIEDGGWSNHEYNYQDFIAAGGYSIGGDDFPVKGPSADAPYTHWMPLPAAPGAGGE